METEFPGRPLLKKGSLVVYEDQTPGSMPTVVIDFQYNPEQLRRTIANRAPERGNQPRGAREQVLQVSGPPIETINLTVVLDAIDLVSTQSAETINDYGLLPVMANLERLMYPSSTRISDIESMADRGAVQVRAADLPLTLLVWGDSRVVPVNLTSFSITEEAFDPNLNPIRARLDMSLKVLTYMEFPERSIARDTYIGYQRRKERLSSEHTSSTDRETMQTFVQGYYSERE